MFLKSFGVGAELFLPAKIGASSASDDYEGRWHELRAIHANRSRFSVQGELCGCKYSAWIDWGPSWSTYGAVYRPLPTLFAPQVASRCAPIMDHQRALKVLPKFVERSFSPGKIKTRERKWFIRPYSDRNVRIRESS